MRNIPLSQGYIAIVDSADYERLSNYSWCIKSTRGKNYAKSCIDGKFVDMHSFIIGSVSGQSVDHINGDGLDNRRENLRIATHAENTQNRMKRVATTSKFKGVGWHKVTKKWRVRVRQETLGYFDNETEAALAYNRGAKIRFGQFARLNVA